MKSRLTQIAEGRLVYLKPAAAFSEEKLSGVVLPDRTMAMEIGIVTENRVPLRLFLHSTNPRVRVEHRLTVQQRGSLSVEIDSKGLSIFDEIRGTIDIVYNGGEKSIPYRFTVGSTGEKREFSLSSLKEFSEFAALHTDDAVVMFSWKEFLQLPFMQELRIQALYRTFSSEQEPKNGMIEFLKAVGYPIGREEADSEKAPRNETFRTVSPSERSRTLRREFRLLRAFLMFETALHRESGVFEARREIERLYAAYPDFLPAALLLTYTYLQEQEVKKAKDLLLKVQDEVQKNRLERKGEYALFLYLASIVQGDRERIENAAKLVSKYYSENTTSLLLSIMEYRINYDPERDPKKAAEFLRQCYFRGLHSAAILESTALLYAGSGIEPETLSEYELMSLLYGLRKDLIPEKRMFLALARDFKVPKLLNLYLQVLKQSYLKFGRFEFLQAILQILIENKYTGTPYFYWYREGVLKKLTVPGMFEGYMQSVPKDEAFALPEDLVTYFGYHRESDAVDPAFLYANVLTFYRDRPEILSLYREKIEQYAVKAMKEERYSLSMIPIYQTVLSKDYLNEDTAGAMLQLFSLNEIETALPNIRRAVIYYPELDSEDCYAMEGGKKALIPVFSEEAVIAFENRKGDRFFDPDLTVRRCYIDEELEKQCLLYTGNSLLLRLKEANSIVKRKALQENELFLVTDIIKDKRIAPFYRSRLYEALIDLFLSGALQHVDCSEFLAEAEYESFSRAYRIKIMEILLNSGLEKIAIERAFLYGIEGLSDELLLKLAEACLSIPGMENDERLLSYCYTLFTHDFVSQKILEYLARYFNGLTEDMVALLRAVRKKKASPYDLSERTMTTAFYTDQTRELDGIFEYYINDGARNDLLVKAYLVLRSHEYFKDRRKLGDITLRELKKYVSVLPRICLLALLQYFGSVTEPLDEEDRALLAKLLKKSVEENVILSCFSKFETVVEMPFELENRVYVEYRNDQAKKVSIIGKTFPAQKLFHREMTEIYPGVFVQSFFLYRREWIQYTVVSYGTDDEVTREEGTEVLGESPAIKRSGRYEELLTLEKKVKAGDMKETADYLRTLLEKEALIDEIFC